MKALDFFSSFFWFLFAIYVSIESYRLGLGNWDMPGPGYFSFGGALLLGIISLSVLIKTLRKWSEQKIPIAPPERLRWENAILVLGAMLVYVFLFERIGFILCTFLLMLFFLRVVAPQRWFKAIMVAFFVTLGSYLLFKVLLNIQLPKGIFLFLNK
jgi:putative tricarboxylic transport membrane protein